MLVYCRIIAPPAKPGWCSGWWEYLGSLDAKINTSRMFSQLSDLHLTLQADSRYHKFGAHRVFQSVPVSASWWWLPSSLWWLVNLSWKYVCMAITHQSTYFPGQLEALDPLPSMKDLVGTTMPAFMSDKRQLSTESLLRRNWFIPCHIFCISGSLRCSWAPEMSYG